jgi:hypothetical protein
VLGAAATGAGALALGGWSLAGGILLHRHTLEHEDKAMMADFVTY